MCFSVVTECVFTVGLPCMSAAQNFSISGTFWGGRSVLVSGAAVSVGSLCDLSATENTVKVDSFLYNLYLLSSYQILVRFFCVQLSSDWSRL